MPALKSPINTAVNSIMVRILTPSPHWLHGKSIRPDLFQNDFVAPGKWFRRLIQQFQRRRLTSFLSRRLHRRGCKPDQECRRIWKATAWTDIRHFIAGRKTRSGHRRRNMGEVIKFVSRAELERMRLARIARTKSGGLLQSATSVSEQVLKNELADS
jgi:hypothetical protein